MAPRAPADAFPISASASAAAAPPPPPPAPSSGVLPKGALGSSQACGRLRLAGLRVAVFLHGSRGPAPAAPAAAGAPAGQTAAAPAAGDGAVKSLELRLEGLSLTHVTFRGDNTVAWHAQLSCSEVQARNPRLHCAQAGTLPVCSL